MPTNREHQPAEVPEGAKQAGQTQMQWQWVEPSVWTERMLTALERGVKGGKWFSLIDKVYAPSNLESAFRQIQANKGTAGVDHQTVAMYAKEQEVGQRRLGQALQQAIYRPQAIRRVYIPKPGSQEKRPLGIPTVKDRIVQAALTNVLEPIFEQDFAPHSYGFRPNRGCKDALRRVTQLLKAGYHYVVDADLKSYFDTIPHNLLMTRIQHKIADGRILTLIEAFLKQGVLEDQTYWIPEQGTPQGGVLSPLLSNIYLSPLDHQMAQLGYEMVRYADDFIILCRTKEAAKRALEIVQVWTEQALLVLHPEKTKIVEAYKDGFDFLGYHFYKDTRWPRKKSQDKLKMAIRQRTRRTNGHSLSFIIATLNPVLKGWFEYFKHSNKNTFPGIDGWVRMRLRSILRRRTGRRGRGKGKDHHRWTNAFFAKQGLFCQTTARAQACQSVRR